MPLAIVAAAAAAAPLALFDPDELTLFLGFDDVPGWAAAAAMLSATLAIVISAILWLLAGRGANPGESGGRGWLPLLPWAAALAIYLGFGQPGFYGEQLFVIMKDQADLSQASSISGHEQRIRYVYETLVDQAQTSQAGLRSDLARFGIKVTPYYLVNGMEVDGGPLVRFYLERRPEVDRVLDSPHLRPLPEQPPTAQGDAGLPVQPQWNIVSIGADRVWTELGITGSGITVGISNSGVEGDHPALSAGYRGRDGSDDYNWLDPWNGTASPTDIGGHGTHTTGSILGGGGIGVAPEAEWFACVNLARNLGDPAYYLDCMQFMLAPYPQDGDPFTDGDVSRAADVTNNSWGCPPIEGCDAESLQPAVEAMRAAGIFTVASAGNEGPDCGSVSDPIAIYDRVLSVGAVNQSGDVVDFSSRGPVTVDGSGRMKPDLIAPGEDILSSFPGGSYKYESGTSMAGPHVAGVVALMWSAQPRLIGEIDATEEILTSTALPYTGLHDGCFQGGVPNAAYGYGTVDAYAAVKAALDMK